MSQAQRQAANDWFDHTLYSRLNDIRTAAIILIMHRLHEDDLAGHVLAQEDWEVVRLAAIVEDDETYPLYTELGPYSFTRRPGEALHPDHQPLATLSGSAVSPGLSGGSANNPPDTSFRGSPASTSRHRRRRAAAWSRRHGSGIAR